MIREVVLPIHVLAGMVALVVGYVALFAAKGATLHKRSGKIFVYAMVIMGLLGSLMATIDPKGSPTNIVAGLVTFYLVTTAMRTARRQWRPGSIDTGIRAGGIHGPRRIARHVWRICLGMVVAAGSFFMGPRGRVPEIIYIPPLLPIPVLIPVIVMVFWLVRLRVKKSFRGIIGIAAARTSAAVE
jgi:uncharacterized membrane protein